MTTSRKRAASPDERIVELKIELLGAEPRIWRRVQMPASFTLGDLHRLIQIVMDWDNDHLHQFQVRGKTYAAEPTSEFGPPRDPSDLDADQVTLCQLKLAVAGRKLDYIYDFGDNWHHRIKTERSLPLEPDVEYPRYIDGERAAPPEDSGGVFGYQHLVEAYRNPKHREHEDALEWLGDEFEPEVVDTDQIEQRLAAWRRWRARHL